MVKEFLQRGSHFADFVRLDEPTNGFDPQDKTVLVFKCFLYYNKRNYYQNMIYANVQEKHTHFTLYIVNMIVKEFFVHVIKKQTIL